MTTQVADRSSAQSVGPPPPFDPELAPVVEVLTSLRPPDAYRADNIVEMREPVPGRGSSCRELAGRHRGSSGMAAPSTGACFPVRR
ncbi:hypothetical protein [Lentzea jiangxiensis]|uniref:Uncharacterized protein n=1 Tax=Lentzea jiangxiensis TaxID=641025 RepID=A0A1H0E0T9_9PSEU|nr:hypothetical protein [Lentzea jiangxiensis]SDN75979.1 hypothetical protein SAMN05421507_101192 [Lentzea jiangxiensis]